METKETTKFLPPDAELQTLARAVNGKLKSGRVNFFITEPPEGQPQYVIVFQSGTKRATVKLRNRPTEHDVADIVAGMEEWVGSPRTGPAYTTEVPSWDD